MRPIIILALSAAFTACVSHATRPVFQISERTPQLVHPEVVGSMEILLEQAVTVSWPSAIYEVLGRKVIFTQDVPIKGVTLTKSPPLATSDRIHISLPGSTRRSFLLYRPKLALYASDRKPVTPAEGEHLLYLIKVALGKARATAVLEEWLVRLESQERRHRALDKAWLFGFSHGH